MRRRSLILAALVALAIPVEAQQKAYYFSEHDLQSTSFLCGAFTGKDQNPYSGMRQGPAFITTSGSSTTTAALNVGSNPFSGAGVGDILSVQTGPQGFLTRYITAKASDDSVTVNSAWNLGAAGVQFSYLDFSSGTAATDGWINIGALNETKFIVRIDTFSATSDDIKIECRDSTYAAAANQPVTVWPPGGVGSCQTGNFTAIGACSFFLESPWDACRVCFKANTPGGTQSVSASLQRFPRAFH